MQGETKIRAFINDWKDKAMAYYLEGVEVMHEDVKKAKEIYGRTFVLKLNGWGKADQIEKVTKMVNSEAETKYNRFIAQIEKAGGKIKDEGDGYLTIGIDGMINGWLECENGTVYVNTIAAGGWNIQCFHFRVLVKYTERAA